MATYLDELPSMRLFKRKFLLPINEKDRKHGSVIMLLSPDYLVSKELMNNKFALNLNQSFQSYYMESSINYLITQQGEMVSESYYEDFLNEICLKKSSFGGFKRYDINYDECESQNLIHKYMETYPHLKKLRFTDCTTGVLFVDKDDEVAAYGFCNCGILNDIEVSSCYRNNGYGSKIVNILSNKYNFDTIKVHKDKEARSKAAKWAKDRGWTRTESSGIITFKPESLSESINYIKTEALFNHQLSEVKWNLDNADKYGLTGLFQFSDIKINDADGYIVTDENGKYLSHFAYINHVLVSVGSNDSEVIFADTIKYAIKHRDCKFALCNNNLEWYIRLGFKDTGKTYDGAKVLAYDPNNIETVRYTDSYTDKELGGEVFKLENSLLVTNSSNQEFINEASSSDSKIKQMIYKDRIRTTKETMTIYKMVKKDNPWIRKTFLSYDRYKESNLFIDLYHYNRSFLKKSDSMGMSPLKANGIYYDFITKYINDDRLLKNGYKVKTIFIPVSGTVLENTKVWDYMKTVNPIALISKLLKNDRVKISEWKDTELVFIGLDGYFRFNTNDLEDVTYAKFISLIKKLYNREPLQDDDNVDSPKAIKTIIMNNLEKNQNIEIKSLTGETTKVTKTEISDKINNADIKASDAATIKKKISDGKKKELSDVIDHAAKNSSSYDQAVEKLDDDYVKKLIKDLSQDSENNVKISSARASRMTQLNNDFLDASVKNISVKELLQQHEVNTPLPKTALPIDSINEEWSNLSSINFEKTYNIYEDIIAMLKSFQDKSAPFSIIDLNIEDTSTTEDSIETITAKCEDLKGNHFTMVFDIPKFRNNRFMKLRGNDKTINGQLVLLPVIKTDEDTVQVVSSYNKIFIRRYGSSVGKSFRSTDLLIKALSKYTGDELKITTGDNRKICSKYELPIDYIDLSSLYSKIEVKSKTNKERYTLYFNQDELRSKYKVDDTKGIPIGVGVYGAGNEKVLYYDQSDNVLTDLVYAVISSRVKGFSELYNSMKASTKYTYSKASILNTEIPLIVIMGYNEGLLKAMDKGKVIYNIVEKKPTNLIGTSTDYIKFEDGYIVYNLNYVSSLLMNGLKECPTESYSIKDINSKSMWLDFLDNFGGRVKADGLDNFYDLTMDPITVEICKIYDLPTDYVEILGYANMLLADNKYNRHVDINGNRYRTNELIAVYVYKALCDAYKDYALQLKRGSKKPAMSMKKSIVIDKLMESQTTSDLSIFSPLMEVEAANTISFKGASGMNSDRSYGLDKRTYDKSMINKLAMSTGFAANVGLTRQGTIDMDIMGKRGLIKQSTTDEMGVTKTLSMSEALTPFGTTRDDPFRTAMTFIQTSKHNMRINNSHPLLVTNGADEALPYIASDMFAFKAKKKGTIKEHTNDYIKIDYDDGTKDYVDLRENVKKNSDGGVYEILKLSSDLKTGDRVKPMQIIAYDELSFSKKMGKKKNPAANIGILTKLAILNTDEGYEDSAIVSDWLSNNMASDVVIKKEILLPKNTNIYNMVKKGDLIQEGDPLMVFQNSFDEDEANMLLRNLTADGDEITDLGRIQIKSKVTGSVQDIKVYRTVELDELSPSLKKYVSTYERNIKKMKDEVKDYVDNPNTLFDPDYKLTPTGKVKNANDMVLIEFYLKYNDTLSVGDKIVYYSALKGVVKGIFPVGDEPYSDYRGESEKIDTLLSVGSVNGRMVTSIILTGCINKAMIELSRHVRDIMDIKYDLNDYKYQ